MSYYSDINKRASLKYRKDKQKAVSLSFKKEEYEQVILPAIQKTGKPAATFIKEAIYEKIDREGLSE